MRSHPQGCSHLKHAHLEKSGYDLSWKNTFTHLQVGAAASNQANQTNETLTTNDGNTKKHNPLCKKSDSLVKDFATHRSTEGFATKFF